MKLISVARGYGSRLAVAGATGLASAASFADTATLPDLTAQVTAVGTQVQTQATGIAGAVVPFVLFVTGVVIVFGIAKKLFRKIG